MSRCDKRFDELMLKDIKLHISEAFIDLEEKLRVYEFKTKDINHYDKNIVKEKANQMKVEINTFIDSQVERITNERISIKKKGNEEKNMKKDKGEKVSKIREVDTKAIKRICEVTNYDPDFLEAIYTKGNDGMIEYLSRLTGYESKLLHEAYKEIMEEDGNVERFVDITFELDW